MSSLGLPYLQDHWKVTLASSIFWAVLQNFIGPVLSSIYFPKVYPTLSPKTRFAWNIRVVAFVHAVIVTPFSYYYLRNPPATLVKEPLVGYDKNISDLFAFTLGYFLWDTTISVIDAVRYKSGWGFVIHGVACTWVFSNTFRPFAAGFGSVFLLWELSTIFLNPHWFFDKLNMTGSKAQFVNGIFLLGSFFVVRLIIGPYQSYQFWKATILELRRPEEIGGSRIGLVLGSVTIFGNIAVNSLNVYWFRQMIAALQRRFRPANPSRIIVSDSDGESVRVVEKKRH